MLKSLNVCESFLELRYADFASVARMGISFNTLLEVEDVDVVELGALQNTVLIPICTNLYYLNLP